MQRCRGCWDFCPSHRSIHWTILDLKKKVGSTRRDRPEPWYKHVYRPSPHGRFIVVIIGLPTSIPFLYIVCVHMNTVFVTPLETVLFSCCLLVFHPISAAGMVFQPYLRLCVYPREENDMTHRIHVWYIC